MTDRMDADPSSVQWSSRAQAGTSDKKFSRIQTIKRENFTFADKKAFGINNPHASKLKVLKSFRGVRGEDLTLRCIKQLLRPNEWMPQNRNRFFLTGDEILRLIAEAQSIFMAEPTLLRLKGPIKIFGDIHGQYDDLMRLMEEYGYPVVAGDLTITDYLFLGDYVDRGNWNLEVICLLMALKVHYPQNVFLIRGNHEIAEINKVYGFHAECCERLGTRDGTRVWEAANTMFQWLPMAALIENKILCMHGGIGDAVRSLSQIDALERPLPASFWVENRDRPIVNALLWSDPTLDESRTGYEPSDRGGDLKLFGPDIVDRFCSENKIDMIVRAHQCVLDGFERFAKGKLVTLFSATNYCNSENNAGAILQIGRGLIVVPKVIFPTDDAGMWNSDVNQQYPPSPAIRRPIVEEDNEGEDDDEEFEEQLNTQLTLQHQSPAHPSPSTGGGGAPRAASPVLASSALKRSSATTSGTPPLVQRPSTAGSPPEGAAAPQGGLVSSFLATTFGLGGNKREGSTGSTASGRSPAGSFQDLSRAANNTTPTSGIKRR